MLRRIGRVSSARSGVALLLWLAVLASALALVAAGPIARVAAATSNQATAALAISIPPAPGFDGLTPNQAIERLSNYGNTYQSILGQIGQAESAGTIDATRAGQLRASVAANIQQLNANYFAWRDAYNRSNAPASGGSSEGGGSGDSGSGSGNSAPAGENKGSSKSPRSRHRRKSVNRGGGHRRRNTTRQPTGKRLKSGVPAKRQTAGSNARLHAAAMPATRDAAGGSKRRAAVAAGDSPGNSLADEMRHRATVARAVDGVPLGLRLLLLALLFTIAMLSAITLRERRRARRVERVAQLDYLTGLANREGFDRMLALEWSRAARYGRPLGIVFVDLDHFKLYNDTYGHLAGDRLLRQVAAAISETARGSDFTARLGGDEFVVLCPEATDEGLDSLAERLTREVSSIEVTLSIGWALQRPDDLRSDDLIARADASMYRAKDRRRRPLSVGNPMLGSLRRSPRG